MYSKNVQPFPGHQPFILWDELHLLLKLTEDTEGSGGLSVA